MLTLTVFEPLPPGPLQVSVNALVLVKVALVSEPAVLLPPDHAPEAVQEVASVADHVRFVVPPLATDAGLAVKATTGAGGVGLTERPYVPAFAVAFGTAMKFR